MIAAWPRRPRLVAGNWKMNKTATEAGDLAGQIVSLVPAGGCEVVICPPFTALHAARPIVDGTRVMLGAQNLHAETHGAYTGEIAGPMLVAAGCRFVIVGHSERRRGLGETDEAVAAKLRAAQRDALRPIACVGETLQEREAGQVAEVLERQIGVAFRGLGAEAARATIVAYEPVWAIGTGRVATPEQAREAHRIVRAALDRAVGPGAGDAIAVLYGGSVTADNAGTLFAEADIDGALVGGASLDARSFGGIMAAASRLHRAEV